MNQVHITIEGAYTLCGKRTCDVKHCKKPIGRGTLPTIIPKGWCKECVDELNRRHQ